MLAILLEINIRSPYLFNEGAIDSKEGGRGGGGGGDEKKARKKE